MRNALPGDAGAVAGLLDALGYPCTRDEAAERIAIVARDPRQILLLAELDGAACGLLALHWIYSVAHGADIARITALIVAPACHRQGIGRRLLREAEQLARRARMARIEVTSAAQRNDAHVFYRDCGYSDGSLRFVKLLGD